MDQPSSAPISLPPPAISTSKNESPASEDASGPPRGSAPMERTDSVMSTEIRREGEELREAAEQSTNVVLDLTLDGQIRWASPMWEEIVGIPFDEVQDTPIADILADGNTNAFSDALAAMRRNDARSKIIHFAVKNRMTVSESQAEQTREETQQDSTADEPDSQAQHDQGEEQEQVVELVDLEAQGILVYDRISGEESHTMWMIKPQVVREVTIDLPYVLVDSLGVGAEMLASHLTRLADVGTNDPEHHPPPMPVLCRICERQITPWWFPKHTELCLQEHRAEAELQLAHDSLTEHRGALVKVLDALEAQMRLRVNRVVSEGDAPAPALPEYKGLPIGQPSPQLSARGSARNSPSSSRSTSRERSGTTLSHTQSGSRSFTVRRPLSRIVELVLDLCDTALEISTPSIKEGYSADDEDVRTQSPQSENRIAQVINWQSPSSSALESEQGLTALCDDTTKLSRAKADAVLHYRRILEYSERIRSELMALVQDCIEAALQKAARIADGESSSSDSEASEQHEPTSDDNEEVEKGESELTEPVPKTCKSSLTSVFEGQSAMATALRQSGLTRSPSPVTANKTSQTSGSASIPNSAWESRAQKSSSGSTTAPVHQSSMSSVTAESDAGVESDGSLKSVPVVQPRPRRPSSDHGRITGRSRERKRTSLHLTRTVSVTRHDSPAQSSGPASPLRVNKPRLPSGQGGEPSRSPILSPVMSGNEYQSPSLPPAHVRHHRRQSSAASSELSRGAMLSPRLSISHNHPPRAVPPSIKDFEIIKPISKGAFGSVYLAKKKSTGDYYAIKALKKADMVAKNQVQNVKAERAILMWQGESDFVAKLYWTFPSKDFIFLVMEYLNGGDCASLVRALGSLPEEWAKRYMAEVVQGVEHLHSREIVHRDLKPDNLLIDQKGHLKLTDFGLSRMGLIGRQKRALSKVNTPIPDPLQQGPFHRSISIASSRSASFDMQGNANAQHDSPATTPSMTPVFPEVGQPSYFNLARPESAPRQPTRQSSMSQSEAGGDVSELATSFRRFSIFDDPWAPNRASPKEEDEAFGAPLSQTTSNTRPPNHSNMPPPMMALFDPDDRNRRFVGTPDYLAPETIKGLGQDEMSDWWSIGCICFEFLFGYPPFHAETPDQVFDNILSRRIDWPPQDVLDEVSPEVRDLMGKLMTVNPAKRLGANTGDTYESGGEEIRKHPWFSDIDWNRLAETEPSFVPAPENIEDTEYFDTRGATDVDFSAEFEDQALSSATPPEYERPHDALARVRTQVNSMKRGLMPLHIPPHVRDGRGRRLSEPAAADDFGQFAFKNLPVLEKANKDVIQKLRTEAMQAQVRSSQPPHSAGPNPPTLSTSLSSPAGGGPAGAGSSGTGAPSTPTLEGSPVLSAPLRRAISTKQSAGPRSTSPASRSSIAHSASPGRASQPPSPLVQFSAGQIHEQRKTSSGSHGSSHSSSHSGLSDLQRLNNSIGMPTAASVNSPVKLGRSATVEQRSSAGTAATASLSTPSSPRNRSQTVGGSEGMTSKDIIAHHRKRHSQVLDISPSSSETEDSARQKALLKVQRRRQSSRRLSQISLTDGPIFRPLDVLICEDHPVSRLVMEKLLEKLRCRTIIVRTGPEAIRYALSAVKFDIIMMEYKLPQINGADVARMIRETKNANCHTPIVAVTGYLRELQAPHHFDALIEKPPTMGKFTDILAKLCNWKPHPPGFSSAASVPPLPISNLRRETTSKDNSPTSTTSGFMATIPSGSYTGSSREDSMSSVSMLTDPDGRADSAAKFAPGSAEDDWSTLLSRGISGLGISDINHDTSATRTSSRIIPSLLKTESSPAYLEQGVSPTSTTNAPSHAPIPTSDAPAPQQPTSQQPRRIPSTEEISDKRSKIHTRPDADPKGGESGDDEDEELGDPASAKSSVQSHHVRALPSQGSARVPAPPSRLGVEMMRSDSRGSVTEAPGMMEALRVPAKALNASSVTATTPPEIFPKEPGDKVVDFSVRDGHVADEGRLSPAYTTALAANDAMTPPHASSEEVETPRPLQPGTPEFNEGPTPRAELSVRVVDGETTQ